MIIQDTDTKSKFLRNSVISDILNIGLLARSQTFSCLLSSWIVVSFHTKASGKTGKAQSGIRQVL
jgi:hypothetical protein